MDKFATAPRILFVNRLSGETTEDFQRHITQSYSCRSEDDSWGLLWDIGETVTLDGRSFVQIRTFAGSLVFRMLMDVNQGRLDRDILCSLDEDFGLFFRSTTGEEYPVNIDSANRAVRSELG